jgi:hypothetical protein
MLALSCKWSFCSRVATPTTFICDSAQCVCYILKNERAEKHRETERQRDRDTERPRVEAATTLLNDKTQYFSSYLLEIVILLESGDSYDVFKQ